MLEPYSLRRFYETKMDLDEEIYAWSRGQLVTADEPPVPGVLVATHRRVCFFGVSRLRRGQHWEEISMQTLVDVTGEDESGRILLDGAAGRCIEFIARRRADRDGLLAAIQQARDEWLHAAAEEAAGAIESRASAPSAAAGDTEAARLGQDEPEAASPAGSVDGRADSVDASPGAERDDAEVAREAAVVEFPGVTYIRGVPGLFDPIRGMLWVDREAVRFGDEGKAAITLDLGSISSVEVISDVRFLPSGERNRGAVARSMSSSPPASTSLAPSTAMLVTRRQEITIWYLSIGYLATGGTFEALFSIASWGSPRFKASEIRNLILTRREAAGFQATNTMPGEAAGHDSRARLMELRNLLDAELISAEEYEAKRREILERL